jgi:hypothetical protein
LAAQLVKDIPPENLDNELLNNNISEGRLEFRALELCMRENPEHTLGYFYGITQLRALAGDLGLVSVRRLSEQELIDILVWRLGFSSPPKLRGLRYYQDELSRSSQEIHAALLIGRSFRDMAH